MVCASTECMHGEYWRCGWATCPAHTQHCLLLRWRACEQNYTAAVTCCGNYLNTGLGGTYFGLTILACVIMAGTTHQTPWNRTAVWLSPHNSQLNTDIRRRRLGWPVGSSWLTDCRQGYRSVLWEHPHLAKTDSKKFGPVRVHSYGTSRHINHTHRVLIFGI